MTAKIKVILADDHPVVRRGLAAILDFEDDISVIGEAENGREALDLAHKLAPDVVLMDLQMPVLDGVQATRQLQQNYPHIQVIVLTTFADDEHIYQALSAGARGFLLKDAPPDQLIEAIRAAHQGNALLAPEVTARLLDRISGNHPITPAPHHPTPSLTPREQEVLTLLAQGARNKEIAETLVIAERTVKIHVGNILTKLNASNRTEAVSLARQLGVL